MALTKEIKQDKIEIVTDYKHIQIREQTTVKEDDAVISRAYTNRYVLTCGKIDASDNFVDNPLDKEPDGVTAIPDDVKSICGIVWTTDVKSAYKTKLTANKG